MPTNQRINTNLALGAALAVLATIIWSGNFIIARKVIHEIPPVALAFFRWLTASLIMIPIGWKQLWKDYPVIKKNLPYFFYTALTGVTLFNTFVYVAGHYSPAINLALIGTTTSPIISIFLARIFLGEKITGMRVAGLTLCIAGILYLLSQGSMHRLLTLQFGKGDAWVLLGACAFAIYNILVRKKPPSIGPGSFLLAVFWMGTLLLLPAWLVESAAAPPVVWDNYLISVILYLGVGTSVISFLCWNAAIARLGAARTALFGNLIPIFSSLEALLILHEKITYIHIISGVLVIAGLVLANLSTLKVNKSIGQ